MTTSAECEKRVLSKERVSADIGEPQDSAPSTRHFPYR